MAKRILNRKEMRADYDAAERRKTDDGEEVEDEADADDEDEDEEEDEEEGDEEGKGEKGEKGEEEDETEEDAEEVVEKPKKKKKAPAAPKVPKPKAKSRSRAAKIVRLRLVWGVFNNSHQCVATYEYPKRKEADAHAAKLTTDKKSTHFVQPVKEPIEEKKEKEKE